MCFGYVILSLTGSVHQSKAFLRIVVYISIVESVSVFFVVAFHVSDVCVNPISSSDVCSSSDDCCELLSRSISVLGVSCCSLGVQFLMYLFDMYD